MTHDDGARPTGRFAGDFSAPGDNSMSGETHFQRGAVHNTPAAHPAAETASPARISPGKTTLLVRNKKSRKDYRHNGTRASHNGSDVNVAKSASQTQADALLPLTKAQRGIWIGSKISRVGTVFNIAEALEIMGPVDPALFKQAILQVVREVETTRTNIVENADGPYQIVHAQYQGDIPFIDCSGAPDPQSAAFQWMDEEIRKPVDIDRDPLWKSALIKTAQDRYYWYQCAHHIIFDGFSGGLVTRRVADIYNCLAAGKAPPPSPFNPLRLMIEHEQTYRASKTFARDRQYWIDRLQDLPDPVSFAPGKWPTANGLARHTLWINPARTQDLRVLAKNLACSVPQLLNALAAAFIYRTTGTEDLIYGMPVSGRMKALRSIPGMSANAILLRLAMSGDLTLETLTRQVARVMQSALRRQQYRFEDLRRDLGLTGQHQHVARIAVNIEPFDYQLTFGGHDTVAHNIANSSVEDLVIFIYDRDDGKGLRIDFDANPSLYTDEELRGHAYRFNRLVEALLDNPKMKIADVDLLTDEDRQKTLIEWNDTGKPGFDRPAFAMIEEQARLAPGAPAIRFGDRTMTYAELNARANALAWELIKRGVGAGDIVALATPRSECWPIAVLGVHKAGAAFLPMDIEFPANRLRQLINDSGAAVILSAGNDFDAAAFNGSEMINIDQVENRDGTRNPSATDLVSQRNPSDPAYLIYTSGSTGRPKGVLVSQANLSNMIGALDQNFPTASQDRLIAVASPTFDASIMEIFPTLCAGATLVLAPNLTIREPAKLSQLMRREGVTKMMATPALWDTLISTRTAPLQNLKACVGGDVLTSKLARTLHDLGAHVSNHYGPTENTVIALNMAIDEDDLQAPPLGRPIANTTAYILDANLRPLPIGVAGELFLGGASVALGYHNQPELTAERFIPDPFGKPGERLYRTGDLAKWRRDGVLEFLGRCDRQLKIRGYRIEPGEVEAALCAHKDIEQSVVDGAPDPSGRKRLVAFIVPRPGAKIDDADIRHALSKTLPEFMIPSIIITMDEMPLTPSHKIDRSKLPPPVAESNVKYVAPRTPTEQQLADIFAGMLGVDRVGVEDSFFDLGADSLTAVQLLAEIESQFSAQLSLLSLFDAPTIANLASQMDNQEQHDPFAALFPLRKNGDAPPLFCVHSVIGIGWSYAGLLRHLGDKQPVYGLQARGLGADEALPASIEEMAEDYISEIRAIQPHGPYHLLGWSLGGLTAHAIAEKLEASGEKVELLALLDAFPSVQKMNGAAPDEASLVKNALRFINYPPDALGDGALTMDRLGDFVFEQFDVFSMPILKKAGMDDERLRRAFIKVISNNSTLARGFRPGKINADILVFRAGDGKHDGLDDVIDHRPGVWEKFTSGRVSEHNINCHHYTMMNPEHLDVIGPLVRDQL